MPKWNKVNLRVREGGGEVERGGERWVRMRVERQHDEEKDGDK